MRLKPEELLYELEQDPERRVFVVEGIRDLSFWKTIATARSSNSVIYPIEYVEAESGEGGQRGRLLRSALTFIESPQRDRIRLFADADVDRVLQRAAPQNVFLTDGRDLESYALCSDCLQHLCETCFPQTLETPARLLEQIRRVARPIGIMRVMSARSDLQLPFRRTLDGRMGRYLAVVGGNLELELEDLLRAVLQNSPHGLARMIEVRALYEAEVAALAGVADDQIVHGKDMTELLAIKFHVEREEIARHLFMCMRVERERIAVLPGIRAACHWLR